MRLALTVHRTGPTASIMGFTLTKTSKGTFAIGHLLNAGRARICQVRVLAGGTVEIVRRGPGA
jgi:hypothetical protein